MQTLNTRVHDIPFVVISLVSFPLLFMLNFYVVHFYSGDLAKMEYFTQCTKEALRFYSPVFFIQRIITEDIELHGHFIPKGIRTIILELKSH